MAHGRVRAGPEITVGEDARITRVGAFLRRTKIDELPQLVDVLRRHRDLVAATVASIPGLTCVPAKATYLSWIDCRQSGVADPQAACEAAGLGPSDGREFGTPGFIRLNNACPTDRLEEALRRLTRAFTA